MAVELFYQTPAAWDDARCPSAGDWVCHQRMLSAFRRWHVPYAVTGVLTVLVTMCSAALSRGRAGDGLRRYGASLFFRLAPAAPSLWGGNVSLPPGLAEAMASGFMVTCKLAQASPAWPEQQFCSWYRGGLSPWYTSCRRSLPTAPTDPPSGDGPGVRRDQCADLRGKNWLAHRRLCRGRRAGCRTGVLYRRRRARAPGTVAAGWRVCSSGMAAAHAAIPAICCFYALPFFFWTSPEGLELLLFYPAILCMIAGGLATVRPMLLNAPGVAAGVRGHKVALCAMKCEFARCGSAGPRRHGVA